MYSYYHTEWRNDELPGYKLSGPTGSPETDQSGPGTISHHQHLGVSNYDMQENQEPLNKKFIYVTKYIFFENT